MSRRLITAVCVALCALLTVPAVVSAKPVKRGFGHTYPHASRLCAKAEAGRTPKHLRASTAEVVAACTTLRTGFTAAQTTFNTTTAPIKLEGREALKTLRATCRQARASHDPAACKAARAATRTQLKGLRGRLNDARVAYRTSVDGARKAFWATIRALPGGAKVPADATVPAAPTAELPSAAAVNAA